MLFRSLGFNFFDPTKIKSSSNFIKEGISAGPEREVPIIGDPTGASRKMSKVEEDKDPCRKGYEMVGMKKKGGRKVPNCVPKEQVEPSASRYTERPTYEANDKYPDSAERGIYEDKKEVVYTHKKGPLYGTVTQHDDERFSSRRKVGMHWKTAMHKTKEGAIAHLEKIGRAHV